MGEALCPSFQNAAAGKALGLADKFVVKGQKRGMLPAGCQMEGICEIKAGFISFTKIYNIPRSDTLI
jgi:hypothetical protein